MMPNTQNPYRLQWLVIEESSKRLGAQPDERESYSSELALKIVDSWLTLLLYRKSIVDCTNAQIFYAEQTHAISKEHYTLGLEHCQKLLSELVRYADTCQAQLESFNVDEFQTPWKDLNKLIELTDQLTSLAIEKKALSSLEFHLAERLYKIAQGSWQAPGDLEKLENFTLVELIHLAKDWRQTKEKLAPAYLLKLCQEVENLLYLLRPALANSKDYKSLSYKIMQYIFNIPCKEIAFQEAIVTEELAVQPNKGFRR